MRMIELDVTGLSEETIEDIRAHIRGMQEGPPWYYQLGTGFRCFHCGEMFRTPGGAALHFGKPTDKRPICFTEPCPYCSDGKRTGLPNNACENCMNTGLKYPERRNGTA